MARWRTTRRPAGFTLVEVVIATAVLVLLAGAAWPLLADSARKARRADALHASVLVQQAQERWAGDRLRYTNALSDLGLAARSPAGHYDLALSGATDLAYTLSVTAASGGAQAQDTGCTQLTVAVQRGQASYAPAACWSR